MSTGEYPNPKAATVDERTRFGWPVMTAALTLAFLVGAAHFRLQMVDAALSKHLETTAEMVRVDHAHEVRITRLEDSIGRVEKVLERIDRKLDRLAEEPIRPAGLKR